MSVTTEIYPKSVTTENGITHYEYEDGRQSWWKGDKRHRVDGPSFQMPSGYTEWQIEGVTLDDDELCAHLRKLITLYLMATWRMFDHGYGSCDADQDTKIARWVELHRRCSALGSIVDCSDEMAAAKAVVQGEQK